MENNIDTQLELALETMQSYEDSKSELYVGYNAKDRSWQLLIRYNDDITDLVDRYLTRIYYLLAGYAIIEIKEVYINAFAADPRILYVDKSKSVDQQVSYAQYASCLSGTFINNYGLDGSGTLLAVIDSGIDYRHNEFIRDGKSRILELWDQQAEYQKEYVNPYELGRIYTNEELNAILDGNYTESLPSEDRSGHGTQVTAIAAGTNIGVAPQTELLIIKVGSDTASRLPTTLGMILGIDYALRKGIERNQPISVNLSYGNNYGSHKGDSLMENYINDVSRLAVCSISTGTGNDAINRRHQRVILGNTSYRMIDLLVSDYVTSFNLQLWKNYNDRFDVMIITPNGDIVLTLSESQNIGTGTYRNTFVKGIYGTPNPYNRNQEIFISFQGRDNYIDKGQWKVLIHPKQIVSGVMDAYLPIRASLTGNVEFLNPTEFGTLTIPSTAEGLITVAAYDQNVDDFAYFSGRGYTANDQIKPDLAAPGVDIYTAYPGNDYSFASGTSMAVPFVSGSACLLMQWGIVNENDPFLYGEKLKASLIRGAKRIKSARTYPNIYVGWGTLCVENSIR